MKSNRVLLLLFASLFLPGLTAGMATADAPVSVSLPRSQAGQEKAFWTPARMREAVPLDAGGAAPRSPRAATASSFSEVVPNPTLPAYSQNGAVFFVIGHGEYGRCSATSVDAPNMSVVFTAGHCVHEEGQWFGRKWVFIPGYHHGIRPFGVFPARWLGSTPGWVASEDENYDVGAAVVSRNERGQLLAGAVGGAGIAWNLSPHQTFDVYGYPVAPPFDGSTLRLCPQAAFEGHDLTSFLQPGPLDLAVQCNVSAGASGGGWTISGNVLNGITTDVYSDDETTDFGPYFGGAVGRLFHEAAAIE